MIEEVNGVVIGHMSTESFYRFYALADHKVITEGWFADDADAEDWVRTRFPESYKRGVEMRCYGR